MPSFSSTCAVSSAPSSRLCYHTHQMMNCCWTTTPTSYDDDASPSHVQTELETFCLKQQVITNMRLKPENDQNWQGRSVVYAVTVNYLYRVRVRVRLQILQAMYCYGVNYTTPLSMWWNVLLSLHRTAKNYISPLASTMIQLRSVKQIVDTNTNETKLSSRFIPCYDLFSIFSSATVVVVVVVVEAEVTGSPAKKRSRDESESKISKDSVYGIP